MSRESSHPSHRRDRHPGPPAGGPATESEPTDAGHSETRTHTVGRRAFLAGAGALSLGTVTGCLGSGNAKTNLPAPDLRADPEDLAYPAYGQRLPDVTLPAPLHGTSVEPRNRDATVVMTFFYSYCESVCPRLIGALRNLQSRAGEAGYADSVEFLPVTFDPERDTADRLRTYAEAMHIDLEAGNWYFLRPDGVDRAEAVIADTFGLRFKRTDPNPDEPGYMFTHMPLILLANPDGYVERSYTDQRPAWQSIAEDLRAVVDASADS